MRPLFLILLLWSTAAFGQSRPLSTQPPSTQPPSTQPPSTQPPSTQPPSTQPPSTQPPSTQPPSTQPPSTQPPKIRLLSRAKKNSILLRWAVTTPGAWLVSNKYGFRIERYTVLRDNKRLAVPEKKIIPSIKPRPLKDWETIIKTNNYAAVMAQAIYGQDFEVSGGRGMGKMITTANELQQRFSLSLYAADNSFEATKYAGWGWEDSTVQWNEKYLYRVLSAVPDSVMHLDSASAFIGTGSGYTPLPNPGDIGAIFGDKTVMLSWDYSTLKNYYHSYIIQRSADGGKTFQPLPGLPVANLNNKSKKPSSRMFYTDSLADNQTPYEYRIAGISPFGEEGPPSASVKGHGRSLLAFVPHIRRGAVDKNGWMDLEWEFDSTGNKLIKGFVLSRCAMAKGEYQPVAADISPEKRTFRFGPVINSDYYIITAVAREGASRTSFPQRVLLADSIPPAAPTGVTATVDTNGIVTVEWAANTEPDLLGYRVLRGASKGEELAVLTSKPWKARRFRDTVALNMLNDKLYYAVVALDQHYNKSTRSVIVEVRRPDRIPPVSPVIQAYKVQSNGVWIHWVKSTSPDVAAHELYRKGDDSTLLVARFTDTTQNYVDSKAAGGKAYTYYLIAIDSAGLQSPPSPGVAVVLAKNPADRAIRALDSYVDRDHRYIELSWSETGTDLREYQLYRGSGAGPVSLWKVVPASAHRRVVDEGVIVNTKYVYGIRAVGKDGTVGPYKSIEVTY